jgi:hypothetical protein
VKPLNFYNIESTFKIFFQLSDFESLSESGENQLIGGFSNSISITTLQALGDGNNCLGGNCTSGCGDGQNISKCNTSVGCQ